MKRTERLYALIEILKDGELHRAEDLAERFGVSLRTMYRDMDMLAASGIPVEGERGRGYSARAAITLPPLNLTEEELDVLLVTLAAAGQSSDDALRTAALSLAEKIDAVLPEDHRAAPKAMNFAAYPFAESAYAFQHLTNLRGAIRAKQRIAIATVSGAAHDLRPLKLDYWGRVWSLTAWVEDLSDFGTFRVDQIDTVRILPGLFVDEPGKTLADLDRRAS
ncbi:helix-turn-helix transcriptional regulator [Cognatishimia sp.]|uniref:helix-turn-helix transcriptional regulator n=1 Tax=Cognatishimia sp. TaxID=2211648 RepID=UPI0035136D0B|nr:HTH domain-containing protein [Cognatishimia sp.]